MTIQENLNIDNAIKELLLKALNKYTHHGAVASALECSKKHVYILIDKYGLKKIDGKYTEYNRLRKVA